MDPARDPVSATAAAAAAATATATATERSLAKATRRTALLAAAARLFAERGYTGVSLEELGAAVGVSGPAVYRHFSSKQAVLGAVLVGASEQLLEGGRAVAEAWSARIPPDPAGCMRSLIRFQVRFALEHSEVIRVQDRDLSNLSDGDRKTVRSLQRRYVDLWVDVLTQLHPGGEPGELRNRAHALFGLINSTPHTVRGRSGAAERTTLRRLLESMAWAAANVRMPPSA